MRVLWRDGTPAKETVDQRQKRRRRTQLRAVLFNVAVELDEGNELPVLPQREAVSVGVD